MTGWSGHAEQLRAAIVNPRDASWSWNRREARRIAEQLIDVQVGAPTTGLRSGSRGS